MNPWTSYLVIGFGSALGGLARYGCGLALPAELGIGFPWGTILVNVLGCLAIGAFGTLTGPDGRILVRPLGRQFVMVGICGGYTTFSAFSLETIALSQQRGAMLASANAVGSMLFCLVAVWLGHAAAAKINR